MEFRLNLSNEKFYPGKNILKKYPELELDFAKYLARTFKTMINEAIKKQRYANRWQPLSYSYMRYKQIHNLSTNMWEATGLLRKSIVARRRNGYYMIGVDPTKRYKDGPKVIEVARWMEYGTSTMPARPLFRPIMTYIRKHIRDYWNKFLKLNNIDLSDVK